jgi:DNA-binding winged helix-turn-helix (wHTH) protein/TolB-like protein
MPEKPGAYEFGPFLLDTAQHTVCRDGEPVTLTPKTYDLLLLLVENGGRLMTKDELMRALWPDSFVDESNLTQQISMVRKALGQKVGEDQYIVTVPARGYRFSAPIAVRGKTAPALVTRRSRGWVVTACVVLVMAIAVGWISSRGARAVVPRSLAILPFQSLKADPESEFLGFSLADAVITKLDYVSSLTVRPSSAVQPYRHGMVDLPRVASDLHVDTVLTGNFLRDGNDLRITSQLVDVKSQNLLWKSEFNVKFDRLLTVQDSVAREIIKGLRLSLSPVESESLNAGWPIAPLAYEYYLRGIDLYSREQFPLAIEMLRKCIQLDANYAPAWAHLGRALTANASFEMGGRDEYAQAQQAYEKALALQPTSIEARIFSANLFTDTGRPERAVPLLREALKMNPNQAEVHWELGYAYRFGGMLKESATECERARELDPGVKLTSSALNAYLYQGRYDDFLRSLPGGADSTLVQFYRGFAEYYQNRREQAAKKFDTAFEQHPTMLQARVGKALSYGVRNEPARGLELLRETETRIAQRGVGDPEALYKVAQAYAMLEDAPSALRVLRKSIEGGFFPYPYLASDPLLDRVRNQAEFEQLLAIAQRRHEGFRREFF